MVNGIIIFVLAVAVIFAFAGALKHLKGEGSCCGGGSCCCKKKKLDAVTFQKTVKIQGMMCEHCAAHVTEALNALEGVSAKVNLKKAEAVIEASREVSDAEIKSAVESAGNYTVV